MNDPWKHIRADLARGMDMGDLHKVDIEQLMADADALLHVKRAAEAQNRMWNSPVVSEALAALPDYLKGE